MFEALNKAEIIICEQKLLSFDYQRGKYFYQS